MGNFIDLTGYTFTNLKVIKRHYPNTSSGDARWVCSCVCGNITHPTGSALRKGRTKGCGCTVGIQASHRERTHGRSKTPEYSVWCSIKQRCHNPNYAHFKHYGAKGITVSKEWLNSFETFYKDMGKRPEGKYSIDRKDNDKGYCKDNCRWATKSEQANNYTNNVRIHYMGETLTAAQWVDRLGVVPRHTVYYRIKAGWSGADAITIPAHVKRP